MRRNSVALYYYSPFDIGDTERFNSGTTRYSFSSAATMKYKLIASKFGSYNSMPNLSSWVNAHLLARLVAGERGKEIAS